LKGGDIAGPGEFAPRLLFLFEGLIATVPSENSRRHARAMKKGRWDEVIDCYVTDSRMMARLWDLSWRYGYAVDLITFLPKEAEKPLKERSDAERWPFGWVTSVNPEYLSRQVANDPTVARIYVGNERDGVWFGGKTRWVPDPNVASLLE